MRQNHAYKVWNFEKVCVDTDSKILLKITIKVESWKMTWVKNVDLLNVQPVWALRRWSSFYILHSSKGRKLWKTFYKKIETKTFFIQTLFLSGSQIICATKSDLYFFSFINICEYFHKGKLNSWIFYTVCMPEKIWNKTGFLNRFPWCYGNHLPCKNLCHWYSFNAQTSLLFLLVGVSHKTMA